MLEKVYRIQNNNLYLFSRNKEFLIFNSDTVRWVLIDKEELCFLNNFSQDNKFIQKYKNIYYNFICKGLIKLSKTTSSNNTMISYPRIVYFAVTDECNLQCSYCYANAKCNQTIINTDAANKIIEITPNGILEKEMEYDDYINDENVQQRLSELYGK